MTSKVKLQAVDLARALSTAAAVLADHSVALDRLDVGGGPGQDGEEWDAVDLTDLAPSESPLSASELSDDLVRGGSEPELHLEPNTEPSPRSVGAGTELADTLAAAVASVERAGTAATGSLSTLCSTLSEAARVGARGVAGADLAAVLSGFEEGLRNADDVDAARMAVALEIAAERLTRADDGAHAGCFPAVAAAAADSALAAVDSGAALGDVLIAAADGGLVELESGPLNNPVLADRGVVDAAAAGYLLLLDVLASCVTGDALPTAPSDDPSPTLRSAAGVQYRISVDVEPHGSSTIESAAWLESTWYELGELQEFRHDGARWHGEFTTTLPGAAIEAISEVGRPRELGIAVVEPDA